MVNCLVFQNNCRKKNQLDWSSIKILPIEKCRSKEAYFITKHKDEASLLNKKNECLTISSICKNDFIVLLKFLTWGKEVSQNFEGIKIGCVLESNLKIPHLKQL